MRLDQQTVNSGISIPINGNTKVYINEIHCNGSIASFGPYTFNGNMIEIRMDVNGTQDILKVRSVSITVNIVDKYGQSTFTGSEKLTQILQELQRCTNNKQIDIIPTLKPDGTVSQIVINLYPEFYVISN